METGINSYVSIEEANTYIENYYRSNNPNRTRWGALSEEDKEILLVNACAEIELLSFTGRKAFRDQAMSFPRLPIQYGKTNEGAPDNVKKAQIELALWLSDDAKLEQQSKRKELQNQGVNSFSIGDLSESYKDGSGETPTPLMCPKAKSLLAPYLNGGFETC
ncbi:hypothetical protein GC105_09125 [Alkalibaculum sp. M08DMB]|uniref:Putative DnaT-like domain-containing protein n=1 Tax=Alkalibaculum sporogenes TaxID=2655001 RepID=A0A6A7K9G9_9FIRM|nr:DnaT-like ssDNA-binding protein [Alkalibaculum sporogenes]MPW25951.1 hypothetical protein [Alkalibaculum sporogenes]